MIKKIITRFVRVLFFVTVACLARCKKDDNAIPSVYVDFYVYLTQPGFANLNTVGNWVYVTGGVKGIIVFKKNPTEFAAYERDCPYDPNASNARIEVETNSIIAVDKNCGSKFGLTDNAILNGPATRSMRTYFADYDATAQTIHVHS